MLSDKSAARQDKESYKLQWSYNRVNLYMYFQIIDGFCQHKGCLIKIFRRDHHLVLVNLLCTAIL